jgi:uncharacterized protein YjbI with pentapeptide repeats
LSANFQHVEILRRGPRAWNEWRAKNLSLVPNLSGIALSVGERQMGPINGGPINLAAARLRHASLRFATLTGADLREADLSDADLSDSRLNGANLAAANLSEALLDRADFQGAKLARANLCGASLAEARNLTQGQIEEAVGDVFTLLPAHLVRPETWTGAISQVVRVQQPNPEAQGEALPGRPGAERTDRVSWLVGGPRKGDVSKPADAPQRNSDGA